MAIMHFSLGFLIFTVCSCAPGYLQQTPFVTIASPTQNPTKLLYSPTPTLIPSATLISTLTPVATTVLDFPDFSLFSSLRSGQYFVYASNEHQYGVISEDGKENYNFILPLYSSTGSVSQLSFDKKKLALIKSSTMSQSLPGDRNNSLIIVDLESGKQQILLKGTDCYATAWSPNGSLLATACDGSISVFNLQTGKRIFLPTECWGICADVKWSPDGKWISYQTNSNTNVRKDGIYLLDASCIEQSSSCTKITPKWVSASRFPSPYSWSSDGRNLVLVDTKIQPQGATSLKIQFLDIISGQVQQDIEIPGFDWSELFSLVLSPDEKWIGFNQARGIYKIPVKGGTPVLVAQLTSPYIIQWIKIP